MDSVVAAEHLAYRYLHAKEGLGPLSLSARSGDVLLVAGPSGCGKSTLARCLTGLIPHLYRGEMAGTVWLDGLPTSETPLWQLAERAGLVFQNPAMQMLGSTVAEEIIFGLENQGRSREEISRDLDAALSGFGLGPLQDRAPLTLSGGEQQKVALAATMARRAPVLVLDEPLAMLDSTAAGELVQTLGTLATEGTAVVICEHRQEELASVPGLRVLTLDAKHAPVDEGPLDFAPPWSHQPAFVLEVRGLGVTLGGARVLQDLDLAIPSGQTVAIVGRNGVGKTTLLRALASLQRHDGTVKVDGDTPDLAMVFQNPDLQLFNATVRDEILYGVREPNQGRYRWLLSTLGLRRYEAASPLLLSEGEKKRVALATALMRAPRHGVLLDEPSLGQDSAHKARLMRWAKSLTAAGHIVVMTTHDLSLAMQADRMILMDRTGFVADGPPDEVLEDAAAWTRIGLRVPPWLHTQRTGPDEVRTPGGLLASADVRAR